MMDKQWIVVRSKPRSEKVAHNELVKKNIESYLPLLKERRKWSDRKKWVEFPLFSSYLFARIDIKDSIFVLETQGVNTIVKFGKQIAIVQNSVIEAIRLAMEGGYQLEPVEYFVEGNQVEVIAGPMKGVKGIVAKLKGQNRLIIKIDAIQQALSIQIESKFIRKLNSKNAPIL
ncbi:MAG: UpxY family transcription antiterminator [Candidatus Neomarinimicrobiota bacterium]|nr:UpxY family transcription antiterminator [Candidatus Neomarinimicrobiota bacterium]